MTNGGSCALVDELVDVLVVVCGSFCIVFSCFV